MPRLLTIAEAVDELGVPPGSLRSAAQEHGFLVKMGRTTRIDPDTLPELIAKCRTPRDRDCIATPRQACTSSAMTADTTQRALEIAEQLKQRSRGTSRKGTDRSGQLHPIK